MGTFTETNSTAFYWKQYTGQDVDDGLCPSSGWVFLRLRVNMAVVGLLLSTLESYLRVTSGYYVDATV